jgi:predicted component of type VI protein secretion system
MKVQLIVVQGKPEGKMIPLAGPKFKIGRGETCNLRPNSEEVSREHAEFAVSAETVQVCDLGSRNGTLVNGKRLNAKEPCTLKDSDLIQIGPLTFAISIQGAPVPAAVKGQAKAPAKPKPASPDEISHADIESWLVSDAASTPPERPSGIYGGDTQTMKAYKAGPAGETKSADETADDTEGLIDDESETADEVETISDEEEAAPEELVDESNPFYVAKKQKSEPPATAKKPAKDSSDAASDILRRLMERKRPH